MCTENNQLIVSYALTDLLGGTHSRRSPGNVHLQAVFRPEEKQPKHFGR